MLEIHEVHTGEACNLIYRNWDRLVRFRWTVGKESDGYAFGWSCDKVSIIDWTDNPKMSGVYNRPHLGEWEEGERDVQPEDVLKHMPADFEGKITVVLERK